MRRGSWNMTSYTHVTYPLVGNCVMWRITTREQVGVTAQRMLRSYGTRKSAMADSLAGNYAYFELPNALENVAQHNQSLALLLNNDDNDSSNGGQATAHQIQSTSNTQQQSYGRYIWYFHKDHLSSSTLITNGDGEITQQIEYLPYGEVFLERLHSSDPSQPFYATPYRFNGKELDEETGLYYYGARYMNPRLSIWYATDPLQEKYPNITSYCFSMNSPICVFDADGNEVIWQLGRSMRRISGSLIKTKAYNTVYKRFIKNQDNVFIRKSSDNYFGYAPVEREHNGRNIFIGNNGLQINGDLTVDPTFLAKIILHEGLHQKYQMIHDEGMTSRYPTLSRHMYYDKIMKNYEGEHETMAECCIGLFVSGMKEFDKYYGTLHSDDWYNAMAWMGSLQDSYAWFELSASKREIYKSIIDNEYYYNAYLEALANYNSNKTSRNKQLLLKAQKEVDWKLFNKTRKK